MSDQPPSDAPAPREHKPLPEVLPIFPLTGVLLLPRGRLPLNIFEPRYLAMASDALGSDRLIGMIQPNEPQNDNRGGGAAPNPPLYPVGCAGRITQFSESDDGRYMITLTGVSRFRVREELPLISGYRRVVPDWETFAHDRDVPARVRFDRDRLVNSLKAFFAHREISADWDAIDKAPGEHLVTSLAMACPFVASEKQALLEAADIETRVELLTALLEMAAVKPTTEETGGTRH